MTASAENRSVTSLPSEASREENRGVTVSVTRPLSQSANNFFQFLLTLLLLTTPLAAQSQLLDEQYSPKTKTSLKVTALASQLPATGFIPLRAEIRNDEAQAKTWSFNATVLRENYGYGTGNQLTTLASDFQVAVDPGKQATFDFLVPVPPIYPESRYGSGASANLTLGISAPGLERRSTGLSTQFEGDWPSVLISTDLYLTEKIALDSQINSSGSRGGTEFGASFSPKQAPTSWKAYFGYDLVIMTDQEWQDLPPAARNSILAAVRLGSELQLLHREPDVTPKSLGLKPDSDEPEKGSLPYGAGRLRLTRITTEKPFQPSSFIANIRSNVEPSITTLNKDYQASLRPLQTLLGEKSFNIALVLLVLIAFGIIVGPVNLFVLTKGGNRHRLFITTPLISLGASLLLILIIVFQDGFGGKGHRLALVQIQAAGGENSAYIRQEQIARTGMLFGSSYDSSDDIWIGGYLLPATRWSRVNNENLGGGQSYKLQSSETGTRLEGDWFQSRSEQAQLVTGVRPTRGRIELSNQDGPPTVRSTFDFPLEILWFRAPGGSMWKAENVTNTGPTRLLPATTADWISWKNATADLFSATVRKDFLALSDHDGWFYALAPEAPLLETSGSIKWKTSRALLVGPVVQP